MARGDEEVYRITGQREHEANVFTQRGLPQNGINYLKNTWLPGSSTIYPIRKDGKVFIRFLQKEY